MKNHRYFQKTILLNHFISTVLGVVMMGSSVVQAQDGFWPADSLQNSKVCLLKLVRQKMLSKKTENTPLLKIESQTSLAEFQEAMLKYWKFKPDFFLNVYDATTNTVYLMNARKSYKHPRTPVDSLVHELVHFVQFNDKGMPLIGEDDSLESEAVEVQSWFRDTYGTYIVNDEYKGPCE